MTVEAAARSQTRGLLQEKSGCLVCLGSNLSTRSHFRRLWLCRSLWPFAPLRDREWRGLSRAVRWREKVLSSRSSCCYGTVKYFVVQLLCCFVPGLRGQGATER